MTHSSALTFQSPRSARSSLSSYLTVGQLLSFRNESDDIGVKSLESSAWQD